MAKKVIQNPPKMSSTDSASSAEEDSMEKSEEEVMAGKFETARRYSRNTTTTTTAPSGASKATEPATERKSSGSANKYGDAVQQLTSRGFNAEMATIAVQRHSGDLNEATEWLMGTQIEESSDSPPPPPPSETPQSLYSPQSLQSPQSVASPASPPSPQDWSWEKLLGGHSSIKQRKRAMEDIKHHLHELRVAEDNGRVLLSCFATQILHVDHIYHNHDVRRTAIATTPSVWAHCVDTLPMQNIPLLIEESLPVVIDALYRLIDDNRARAFHHSARQCVAEMIGAVLAKTPSVSAVAALCGVLSEKVNLENVTQAHCRLFTAQQIFERIVFGNDSEIIGDLFSIDLNDHQNGMDRFVHGVELHHSNDIPAHREWLDLIVAVEWKSNDEETLKDIIADATGLLIGDANRDLSALGFNLAVIFTALNAEWQNHLEPEAKYRFRRHFVGAQQSVGGTANSIKAMDSMLSLQSSVGGAVSERILSLRNEHSQKSTSTVWSIPQMTDINISAPSMPDI